MDWEKENDLQQEYHIPKKVKHLITSTKLEVQRSNDGNNTKNQSG
jgi:hypothetical protein